MATTQAMRRYVFEAATPEHRLARTTVYYNHLSLSKSRPRLLQGLDQLAARTAEPPVVVRNPINAGKVLADADDQLAGAA